MTVKISGYAAVKKLKEKKGFSELAACLVAMFSILAVVVLAMSGFKLANEYTTLDTFGDQYIRVMAAEGSTSNDRIRTRFQELVASTGLNPDVTVEASYIPGSSTKVQYGNTITLHLTIHADFSFLHVTLPTPLPVTKTAESEQYWK